MTTDSKIKTALATAAAGLGVATYLVVQPPAPPAPKITLLWDYAPAIAGQLPLDQVTFTIVHRTNLNSPWSMLTNVVGTNRVTLPRNLPQEFFTISRVFESANTNNYLKQAGF